QALATPAREPGVRRLRDAYLHVEAPPVHLYRRRPVAAPDAVRRRGYPCCLMRQLVRTLCKKLRVHDAVTGRRRAQARMLEQGAVEADERRAPLDVELAERAQHPPPRRFAVHVVHDELRDHRVVEAADLCTLDDARVDAHAGPGGLAVAGDPARGGQEPARGVLGVDAALDRVAAQLDLVLRHGDRLARRAQGLLADEVESGALLGDGVLDLDARVHLHEVVVAVRREQPLDRPGGAIAGGTGGLDGDTADARPQLIVDRGRGRLLDELLVAALDRAVALAQVDDIAVAVGEDLHLDVARVLAVALDVDGRVREVLLPLPAGRLERTLGLGSVTHDLHALAAAAGCRLDQERVADLAADPDHLLRR